MSNLSFILSIAFHYRHLFLDKSFLLFDFQYLLIRSKCLPKLNQELWYCFVSYIWTWREELNIIFNLCFYIYILWFIVILSNIFQLLNLSASFLSLFYHHLFFDIVLNIVFEYLFLTVFRLSKQKSVYIFTFCFITVYEHIVQFLVLE